MIILVMFRFLVMLFELSRNTFQHEFGLKEYPFHDIYKDNKSAGKHSYG